MVLTKSGYINPEVQSVCLLLLQIMEMALYLEFCILKICGRSPVLWRVEEFLKEVKLLSKDRRFIGELSWVSNRS